MVSGTITSTDRITDPVLDARVRDEHARGAQADTAAGALSAIEQILPEPSDDGLSARLSDFWSAWGSVATHPGDVATRSLLLRSASSAAASLGNLATSLGTVAQGTAQSLGDDVSRAGAAATQLAGLNAQIAIASATGQNANTLLDQRDQLLGQLSTLIGGIATIGPNGAADVSVGGQALVTGTTAASVAVGPGSTVSVGGTAVTLTGGSAAARVTALTSTIPGYQSRLDAIADSLSAAANSVQAAGYDLSGAAGTPLFTGSGATGITVALTDPSKIAAAATPGGNLDGGNALAASQRGSLPGGPDALYAALIGDVGAASSVAQQQRRTQAAVVSGVDTLRSSIAGVSYDEEVSQMLTFQHAFSASSRVLTTIDQMLDTLINHPGVVGIR